MPTGTQMITLCATDARSGVGGFGALPARFWDVFIVVVVVVDSFVFQGCCVLFLSITVPCACFFHLEQERCYSVPLFLKVCKCSSL